MTTLFWNWRISSSLATLPRGAFPSVNLPPVTQYFPRDYSVKVNDAEGGVHRNGFMTYELLWTRMVSDQLSAFQRIYNETIDGDMYITGLWYDTLNPVIRWVDMSGKPDVTDPTPNVPAFAYGQQVFSTINLKLNNVVLLNDPATYT
jgi:hypothetical protein